MEAYSRLSRRKCEVLMKLMEGKTNRQIASELFISPKTVENHICNIGRALNMKGKGQLRAWINQEKALFQHPK
jgi:DNA-binding NarL/FixJ family response regulator